MGKFRIIMFMLLTVFVIVGCTKDRGEVANSSEAMPGEKEKVEISTIPLTSYAKKIGFFLQSPEKKKFATDTVVDIRGKIEKISDLAEEHVWVVVESKEKTEKLTKDFNYYIPLQNGEFSKQITLHNGAGEYEVSIRVPSNEQNDKGIMYYDAAVFAVTNQDEKIAREVEYTTYGVKNDLQLMTPLTGFDSAEESVYIEGTVSNDHAGKMILVQVEKDGQSKQLFFNLHNDSFKGEVPLYFGEGLHSVKVQLYSEAEDAYYESAAFYANNLVETKFAEVVKYNTYFTNGITIHEPTWVQKESLHEKEYRIKGEIDRTLPGAESINYILVMVNNLDEDVESGYHIPVIDYQFEGLAYFRFGPGNYEVTINIPDTEKHDNKMFYYQGVAKLNHEVKDITDERDLLPSRGIESDHPVIIETAEQITAGISSEREKAKAIYQFVANHVAYDVEKAEKDLFNIGDSALTTLESGSGICQDYAYLTTALLRSIGMESHYIEGYAGERHAWVEVKVDGSWLEMDPTWGSGYVQNGTFHSHYNEVYFDPDPAFLAKTHTRNGIMY